MTTLEVFKRHNLKIALGFINDDVPTYCFSAIDCNDEIFNKPYKKL